MTIVMVPGRSTAHRPNCPVLQRWKCSVVPVASPTGLSECGQCGVTSSYEQCREFVREVEFLLSCGESRDAVAARIGSKRRAIARRLHRAKRHDLAVQFDRV